MHHAGAFTLIELYATKPENPLLREAGVNATGFRTWREFRPLLESILANDPVDHVRERAAAILPYIPSGVANG